MKVCAIWIDDRLMSRQTALAWQCEWNCRRILAVDNISADDAVRSSVLQICSPDDVRICVLDEEQAAEAAKCGKYGDEPTVVAVRRPDTLCRMIGYGWRPESDITVGMLPDGPEKTKLCPGVYATESDRAAFRFLAKEGYRI